MGSKTSNEKVFVVRNSLLTDLAKDKHIRTVYNLVLAILVCLCVNTTVYTYVKHNEITLGLKLIVKGFGRFHVVVLAWLLELLLCCCGFFGFQIWARRRQFAKLSYTKLWDRLFFVLTPLFYLNSFALAGQTVTYFELPIGSAAVVTIEQIRFLMKLHSFLRNNVTKLLKKDEEALPVFPNFCYFLFVPTLLYRDTYPRTEKINWNFAFFRFLECVGAIFFLSFVGDKLLIPSLQEFGLRKYTVSEIVLTVFENTVTGIFMLLAFFLVILNSCQNLFAEITRFGDRMFYSDWWTCTDLGSFFRKWNMIVQEWLYEYVFKEVKENLGYSAGLAKFTVILVSAVVHEWVLTFVFGFFFPLLFLEFCVIGSLLSTVRCFKGPVINALFWYMLSFGMATLCTMYGMEHFARANAPVPNETLLDSITPRFLSCECIEW